MNYRNHRHRTSRIPHDHRPSATHGWASMAVLSLTTLYAVRSLWIPPADDWLLEEEFRRERAATRKGQHTIRAASIPEDGAMPMQSIQHSNDRNERQRLAEDNFLFRPHAPTEIWDDLPAWARSYWEWHATAGSSAKRVLIYHPTSVDDFVSFYDAVLLAANTNRFFMVHWSCEENLAPALRLDWRIPNEMRSQSLPDPVDEYRANLLHDNPTDVVVVQSIIPEDQPGDAHQKEVTRREKQSVWKGMFRPTSMLQDSLTSLVQTSLENRPYAAVWIPHLDQPENGETKKEFVLSRALQTLQCAYWLWEQAHHHGDPPIVFLVLQDPTDHDLLQARLHPTAFEQRLDESFANMQSNLVVASYENDWTNVYLAAGADCLLYSVNHMPLAALLSETVCQLPYEKCPMERLLDT